MGVTRRFINIVKTNRKDFGNEAHLSQKEIENLLKDDSDDELSNLITEASKKKVSKNIIFFPKNIINAFKILEMQATKDIELVSLQFRNMINKYHPDKNNISTEDDKQYFNKKTSEIIESFNIIKQYLGK